LPPLPEATAPHYASSTAPWVNDTATIRPGEAGGHALNRGFGQLLEGSAPMDHAAPAAAPRHEASPARNESSADRGSLHPDDFAAIRGFWNRADAHVEGLMNRINPAGDGLRTPEQLRQFNRELPGALPAHLNNHLYDQGIRSAGRPPIPAEWMPPDWKDRAASVPSGSAPAVPHAGTSASAPAAAEAGPSTSGAPVGEHRREPSPTPSEKAEARENPGTLSPEEKRAFWRQQRKEWSEANMKGGDARGGGRW
jgi:hypothetical protein